MPVESTFVVFRDVRRLRRVFTVALLVACGLSFSLPLTAQAGDYAQAEALVRNHQWDDGLALVLRLLKTEPRNAKALNLAGLALTGRGDLQQAGEYFRKCLIVAPGFVPALKNLAINEFNQKQYDGAEKHLQAALKGAPADPVINLYLGEIAYRQHKYLAAADALGRAPGFVARDENVAAHLAVSYLQTGKKQNALEILDRLTPEGVESQSQFALGLALAQFDLPERSIPYLEAVRRRFPDSYDLAFDLVLTCIGAKDFSHAIQVGTDWIGRGHETTELDNLLAEAYEGDNQTQHAVDALRRAIALAPDDEDNYLDFASLCMNHRSYDAGLKVIQAGLQVHPKSDKLIFMRGVLYGMQDEYDLAEKDFQQAAYVAPQTNLGYVGLGVTYLEKGNASQAIQVLRQRLREKPNDASLLYLLGEALLRNGAAPGQAAYNEAQASLEKSVLLNPRLCLPHVSLGAIYLDEEKFKEAVDQFEQARAIDPQERSAYSHLAVAYKHLGQADKSRDVMTALKDLISQERRATREKMKEDAQSAAGDSQKSTTH
jgi:tetratricopeptide (TPR) repeat protein